MLDSLRRNHLIQFALVSLGVTLLSALAISAYVSYRLNGQIDLLEQHGMAMMSGSVDASAPYSISSIQQNVDQIRWSTLMIASAALAFVYLSGLAAVRRGWKAVKREQAIDREAQELRWQNARLREIDRMNPIPITRTRPVRDRSALTSQYPPDSRESQCRSPGVRQSD